MIAKVQDAQGKADKVFHQGYGKKQINEIFAMENLSDERKNFYINKIRDASKELARYVKKLPNLVKKIANAKGDALLKIKDIKANLPTMTKITQVREQHALKQDVGQMRILVEAAVGLGFDYLLSKALPIWVDALSENEKMMNKE